MLSSRSFMVSYVQVKSILSQFWCILWDNFYLVSFFFFACVCLVFPIPFIDWRSWSFPFDCSFFSFVINYLYVHGFISGIKKMQNIYKMGCYSARKHEILLFATTRVGLEGIVLSEISQWERQRPCDFTHVWTRKKPINKYMKTQNRWTNQTKKEHVDRTGRWRRKGERGKLVRCMVTDGKWSGGGELSIGCAKLEIKCWCVEFVV